MAGGGTPRQRMVNMMYLVLTALLALQVSNAVLTKFYLIDESLVHSYNITRQQNEDRIHSIEKQVEKNGNKPEDLVVFENAKKVYQLSEVILGRLDSLKDRIIEETGGVDTATNRFVGEKDYDIQMAFMLPTVQPDGTESKGEGVLLQEQLNAYIDNLNTIVDSLGLEPIALDAKDLDRFKDDPDQKNKDFAHLNFDHTPTVAAIAVLDEFKSQVAQSEAKALEVLATKVGAKLLKFDRIFAVASAESKTVAAGTKYRAVMFLSASSSTAKTVMTYNGKPVEIGEDGKGKIEFTATAPSYDKEGKYNAKWTGKIRLVGNADTTVEVVEEYTVVKPVIQIQSASVQALYLNCGNALQINVPALGNYYNPTFRASGADVITSSKPGSITVVPSKRKVVLTVNNSGSRIGSETFKVRRIPKPSVVPYGGSRPIDLKNGLSTNALTRISMKAIPDESFAEFLPKDARYNVSRWEAILARGKRAIASKKLNSSTFKIPSTWREKAREGDRIIIEVKEVVRKNFRNKTEKVSLGGLTIFTVPIN